MHVDMFPCTVYEHFVGIIEMMQRMNFNVSDLQPRGEHPSQRKRQGPTVIVEKTAEGVEYDWAYDSALDQDDEDGDAG